MDQICSHVAERPGRPTGSFHAVCAAAERLTNDQAQASDGRQQEVARVIRALLVHARRAHRDMVRLTTISRHGWTVRRTAHIGAWLVERGDGTAAQAHTLPQRPGPRLSGAAQRTGGVGTDG